MYQVDLTVVAPPRAKVPLVYEPSGYLTPGSVGIEKSPSFVVLIPLNDAEHPSAGFKAKPLKAFLDSYRPDLIWIHGEPQDQVTRDVCKWHFVFRKPKIYQGAVDNYQHLGKGLRAIRNWTLLRRIAGFLAISKSTAFSVREDLRIPARRVFVTYLPTIPVDATQKSKDERRFKIGFAGRLVQEKGIFILLDALELLPSNIELVTAGDGEEHVHRRLQAHPRVHHLGLVKDLSKLFSEIDLLVVPSLTTSRWKEQFGKVIAEAFSCKIPVVGSDSGSIPDVVGDAGLIYPEFSPKTLSDRVLQVYSNRDLYRQLSGNAKKRFQKYFSVKAHAQQLAGIFNLSPR